MILVWKFVDDYITENYQKLRKFQQFKPSKKIKLSNEIGKTVENEKDLDIIEEEEKIVNENEEIYFSDFEKKCLKGRFILDKRQEMSSKNTSVR